MPVITKKNQPKAHENILEVVKKLQSEGFELWTFETDRNKILSFYWYENGRVLNINPDTVLRGYCWNFGTSYYPSIKNGTGCALTDRTHHGYWDEWITLEHFEKLRKIATWVRNIKNYSSMEDFLKNQKILKWYLVDKQ